MRLDSDRCARWDRRERGVALLVTLLVVTLLTTIVIEFTYSTEVDAHLTRNSLSAAQARFLARSGLALAELTLRQDAAEKSKTPPERLPIETLADPWAQAFSPTTVADGFGTAGFVIVDESARFNLNSLAPGGGVSATDLEMRRQLFQGVLAALGIDPNLLFPLLDWLDPDDETQSDKGAESEYYLGLVPPYVARNGKMLSLDELALVKGFPELTHGQWAALRSLVTVIPNNADLKINVNTAPELLLSAVFGAAGSEGLGQTIASDRTDRPFQDATLAQLWQSYPLPAPIRSIFKVRSEIFTIHATGTAGDVERRLAVMEQRRPGIFPPRLDVLDWREEVGSASLTSGEPSGGMKSTPP